MKVQFIIDANFDSTIDDADVAEMEENFRQDLIEFINNHEICDYIYNSKVRCRDESCK